MNLKTILMSLSVLVGAGALAASIDLKGGESITIQANVETTVSCGGNSTGGGGSGQSATEKTCAHLNPYGGCDYFNETVRNGRYCATANECGHQNPYGGCDFYNTKAACGSNSCTVQKTCGHQNPYGGCDYFNESVSCD